MTRAIRVALFGLACFAAGAALQRLYDVQQPAASTAAGRGPAGPLAIPFESEPLWAYGFTTVAKPGDTASPQAPPTRKLRTTESAQDQTRPRHVEGSTASYSLVDVRDLHSVIDWFPGDHPPMPPIVLHGPASQGDLSRGCGSCHLPNGRGRPENAPAGGLPPAYFIRQLLDFRNGLRRSADPRKPNTNTMIDLAKAMSDQEMRDAAAYFGAIPYSPWTRVVETATVPKTRISGNLFLSLEDGQSEPIAGRIIEVPESTEQGDTLRNPHSGFVAYVPEGSIARGEDLVTTGGMRTVGDTIVPGKSTPCITCHGLDLTGVAEVPPIAGRSPSYMVRQMWDIQHGTRAGAAVQLMKIAIANLTPDDLLAVAAYVASRSPVRSAAPVETVAAKK